jgi:hypothetical protein
MTKHLFRICRLTAVLACCVLSLCPTGEVVSVLRVAVALRAPTAEETETTHPCEESTESSKLQTPSFLERRSARQRLALPVHGKLLPRGQHYHSGPCAAAGSSVSRSPWEHERRNGVGSPLRC